MNTNSRSIHLLLQCFTFLWLSSTGQNTMDIHQNNGSVLQINLSTIDSITYSTSTQFGAGVTDITGNNYTTVILSNGQEWMAENLRVFVFSNTDVIPSIDRRYYDGDASYEIPYGLLYTLDVVEDERNVCPLGWHVPSDSDWEALRILLDPNGDNISNFAGGKMKTTGTVQLQTGLWNSPNLWANNETGFSAVPGGYRGNEGFSPGSSSTYDYNYMGIYAVFWSSSPSGNEGTVWYLSSGTGSLVRESVAVYPNTDSYSSIRCIKD